MRRHVTVLVAVALGGSVAGCTLPWGPPPALTADEWAWCQDHYEDGLDPSQRDQPNKSTWYFDHMGMPDDPDTIRVCRAAAQQR